MLQTLRIPQHSLICPECHLLMFRLCLAVATSAAMHRQCVNVLHHQPHLIIRGLTLQLQYMTNTIKHLSCHAGAGNQLPVVALDILHMLLAEDQVVLVKMNPVNDYYGPLLRQVSGNVAQYTAGMFVSTSP